ncbi:hypothetical protein G9272_44100 [Streptomyces asoensis]|uniref:Uncharacterized protein n=1 Tax=Streptomyces asoensis TaxID=249586 RepID=A0A6M4WG12_9ACTN|nr:hypothetical protein [Streptomyces asoensis]QJS98927.1 hypothetical protein G9272_44100 [Streptomyces asoensis]
MALPSVERRSRAPGDIAVAYDRLGRRTLTELVSNAFGSGGRIEPRDGNRRIRS